MLPDEEAYVPAIQLVHDVLPVVEVYVPAEHNAQAEHPPVEQKVPATQATHTVDDVPPVLP